MALDSGFSVESMDVPAANTVNANAEAASSRSLPIHVRLAQELSVAASQLIEAAFRARGGDCDGTQEHVAHAIALLQGMPSIGPRGRYPIRSPEIPLERGALAAWQTRKVMAHVEANLSRRIRVRELAELLGLSPSHFCRAFKCAFGTSPRNFVIRRRIEVAQAMMLTTCEPLTAIAASCGICDQQCFTRSFRRIVGDSPSRWRSSRRSMLNVD
jgi:AraC family transcriptional regulator